MAFSGLIPTTDGKIIYAKAQQGKPLHFTRVALGDGLLGGGSMVNRSALISERLSLPIDAIQLSNNEGEAAVVATLRSEAIAEGFYFRELGLFAEDPDTHLDRLYLYDNAGEDGEYLSNDNESVIINERFRLLIYLVASRTISGGSSSAAGAPAGRLWAQLHLTEALPVGGRTRVLLGHAGDAGEHLQRCGRRWRRLRGDSINHLNSRKCFYCDGQQRRIHHLQRGYCGGGRRRGRRPKWR